MYGRPLSLTEVRHRLGRYHVPYRRVLRETIDRLWRRYGAVWHFNCHSMKSRSGVAAAARPDFAIGDRDGTTAPSALTAWVAGFFTERGYRVQINEPYRGGDIVRAHGQPRRRRYSLQIEINRALYMDEITFARGPHFRTVQADLTAFARAVGARAAECVKVNARG
jgi:N-formylglutamate deformylase